MSAFDTTVRVGSIGTEVVVDENGKKHEANLILGILTLAQIGPDQFLQIPIGVIRAPLDKNAIKAAIEGFQKAYDELEDRSDIAIASDLNAVERAAQAQAGLR
jgi:hypothetical protein